MNKISVIGLEEDKDNIMTRLMDIGVVEINDLTDKLTDSEWSAVVTRDGDEDEVSRLDAQMSDVMMALETLDRYDLSKHPLFKTREVIQADAYKAAVSDGSRLREEVDQVLSLNEQLGQLKSEENSLSSTRASLLPWTSYDLPLEHDGTHSVRVFLGMLPNAADAEVIRSSIAEVSPDTELEVLGQDEDQQFICIICMRAEEDKIYDVLKGTGFSPAVFKSMKGTVQENLTDINSRIEEIGNGRRQLEEQLSADTSNIGALKYYYDSLLIRRDKAEISSSLLRTKKAFYFDGWLPRDLQTEVTKTLDEFGCWYECTEPEHGEATPVLLHNASLVVPFESITSMYSLPQAYEVDPTPILAAFYWLFYGMMFADIAYGAILSFVCFLWLHKYKLEGMAYRLIKCLALCGISSIIWGFLYGSCFGNLIPTMGETFFNQNWAINALWFDPLQDPMKALLLSCILGIVHLFVGMGIAAYMEIKNGHFMDAVTQQFDWFLLIIGLILWIGGDAVLPGGAGAGKIMSIIGAVIIVGAPAVKNKGIGHLSGIYDLYGITSYLGDVLSYSRILALGLAGSVIAQVFNKLASLFGRSIVGFLLFIVVALIGHVLNFAINALGAYVHDCRLQYVEFFGKFYEGGGDAFNPFEKKTKYVKIVKEEQ